MDGYSQGTVSYSSSTIIYLLQSRLYLCLIITYESKRPNTHRGFGFGTAMEVRPVRHSTSSKNHDPDHSGHDWKREWIEIASEEFRDIAERSNIFFKPNSTKT